MNNPISKTAYYTLSVRAWDASRPDPVCNDTYAKNFMNPEAQKVWDLFKDQIRPNASNASRHAIIDQYLQDELNNAPNSLVIIIGAGFDTRAFRLRGIDVQENCSYPLVKKRSSGFSFISLNDSPSDTIFSCTSFPYFAKKERRIKSQ